MNIYCTHLNKVVEVYENKLILINVIHVICAINRRRLVCSHDRQMSRSSFCTTEDGGRHFYHYPFYLKSFITFINATNVY